MAKLTDTQIRSHVQSLLARHLIDTRKASVACHRGTVRLEGQIERSGGVSSALSSTDLEKLERELARVWGVADLEFKLDNWRRLGDGEWRRARRATEHRADGAGRTQRARDSRPGKRRAWGQRVIEFLTTPV